MYKLKKIVGTNIFFGTVKIIFDYGGVGFVIGVLRQTANLVIRPVVVGGFVFLSGGASSGSDLGNCLWVGWLGPAVLSFVRPSGGWTPFAPVLSCVCCWVIVFVLSPFVSIFVCTRRWCVDGFGIFCASRASVCLDTHQNLGRLCYLGMLRPSGSSWEVLLLWILFLLFIFPVCLYYTALSVPCSLVITCWERADLFALFCDVILRFITFPYGVSVRCGTWLYWFLIFSLFWLSFC